MADDDLSRPGRPLPGWSLVAVCIPTAAVLGFGASVLPWTRMTAFAIVTGLLATMHILAAALAVAPATSKPPAMLRKRVLRALGFASLLYLAWIAQQVVGSALYVAEIYGALGKGVAAGMGALVGLVALLTLPVGLWALTVTAPPQRSRGLFAWLLGGLAIFAAASGATWMEARATALPVPSDPAAAIRAALPPWETLPDASRQPAPPTTSPVTCAAPLDGSTATVVMNHSDPAGRARSVCLQGPVEELPGRVAEELTSHGSRGLVQIDWLTAAKTLHTHPGLLGPLIDVLALRPGLDGACHGRTCLMPWQLLASGTFAAQEPVAYVPKMRLGFAVRAVRAALSMPEAGGAVDGLRRIATVSLLVDAEGEVHPMRRMRPRSVKLTSVALARARAGAEDHVLQAQHRDGTYRYQLDGYSDDTIDDNPSIPRHAGATLVLCELGSDSPRVRRAIGRALGAQVRYGRDWDDMTALTYRRRQRHASLGSSALGLVAFTACRRHVGSIHDRTIGRIARFLMSMQRPDGSFRPGQDLKKQRKLRGPTPMFAAGQVIMALTQLEEFLADLSPAEAAPFPPLQEVHGAVERAMDHVAGAYWPSPLRDFFFLKENWHCLAARAALRSHRHDGYERFCIDYASFKARLLLGPGDEVDPELIGGFGFGNIVPPHNGSSAGLGEALGAAVALRQARGEDASLERMRLKRVLRFLLRQQVRPELCFACRSPAARGWFSGYMVSPTGRIDHIQHPWSALGHGARALGWHPT